MLFYCSDKKLDDRLIHEIKCVPDIEFDEDYLLEQIEKLGHEKKGNLVISSKLV